MDSRKQFEEWRGTIHGVIPMPGSDDYNKEYAIWQAGRASMRDEAVKACLGKEKSSDCVLAIKEIQP